MGKRSRRKSQTEPAVAEPSGASPVARAPAPGFGPIRARAVAPLLLAVAALAFVVQAGVLRGPFLYDDFACVVRNANVVGPGRWDALWLSPFEAGNPGTGLYRPVTATSLRLDHALLGASPSGFHLVSNLLHAAVAALVAWLAFRIASSAPGRLRPQAIAAGAAAGLLFAVHPVHTEAVSWIVSRSEVLAALFCLLATLAWMAHRRSGRPGWLLAAAAAWFAALGSKESAAPLPAVLLLGEWLGLFGERGDAEASSEEGGGLARVLHAVPRLLPLALAGIAWAALRVKANGTFGVSVAQSVFRNVETDVRLATALAGVARAAFLLVLPVGLRIDYPLDGERSLADPAALAGLAVIAALLASAWLCRHRAPAVTFWLGFAALFYLPASNLLLPTGSVFSERSLYIPSAGACALAGLLFAHAHGRAAGGRRAAAVAALAGAVLLLATGTWRRNRDWADPVRFWRASVAQSPESMKMRSGLADALWEEGKRSGDASLLAGSVESVRAGLALGSRDAPPDSDRARLLNNLAVRLSDLGRKEEARQALADALVVFRSAQLLPDQRGLHAAAANALGLLNGEAGRLEEALALFDEAAALEPGLGGFQANAANALSLLGRRGEAAERWRKAASLEPSSPAALSWRFRASMAEGRPDAAALEVRPAAMAGDAQAIDLHLRAVRALAETRLEADPEGTYAALRAHVELARRAGRLGPDVTLAVGSIAERLGRADEARALYEETLRLDPGSAGAAERLRALAGAAAR